MILPLPPPPHHRRIFLLCFGIPAAYSSDCTLNTTLIRAHTARTPKLIHTLIQSAHTAHTPKLIRTHTAHTPKLIRTHTAHTPHTHRTHTASPTIKASKFHTHIYTSPVWTLVSQNLQSNPRECLSAQKEHTHYILP